MSATCSCGRRLVRVWGRGSLDVVAVASYSRDHDGKVVMGPGIPGEWRPIDNTPACPLPPGDQ
jgi:hypothetical protein